MRHRSLAAATLSLLLACGGSSDSTPPPMGEAIPASALAKNAWTWIDFPDSACGDGSPTGIGISPGDSGNLFVFLEGGGACWTYGTCFVPGFITTPGPFGQAQFQALQSATFTGVLDRADPANPFRDWTLVYVPYCTGDVHTGDRVTQYTVTLPGGAATDTRAFHHVGHQNFAAFMKRLAPTFPLPGKVVLSGTSAGGFGTLANYDTFRAYWPHVPSYVVDDSGPPLLASEIGRAQADAFDVSWGLYSTLASVCPECKTDLGQAFAAAARKYPKDRMSLLSYVHDTTIPLFFLISPDTFTGALFDTAHRVMDPQPNVKHYFVAGAGHTLLRRPASYTVGVSLHDWLAQQVDDTAAWSSQEAAP